MINYGHNCCVNSQRINCEKASQYGMECFSMRLHNITKEFQEANANILNQNRGGGYWLWKPYIIVHMLEQLEEGDYLMYTDAGTELVSSPQPVFDLVDKTEYGVQLFQLCGGFLTSHWTKGDALVLMNCTSEECK
jgi:hypothetical protein